MELNKKVKLYALQLAKIQALNMARQWKEAADRAATEKRAGICRKLAETYLSLHDIYAQYEKEIAN